MSSEISGGVGVAVIIGGGPVAGAALSAVAAAAAAAAAVAAAAAAVAVVGGAVYGTGYLLAKGGQLLYDMNVSIKENFEAAEEEKHRREVLRSNRANAAHQQIVDVCMELIQAIEKGEADCDDENVKKSLNELLLEMNKIKAELNSATQDIFQLEIKNIDYGKRLEGIRAQVEALILLKDQMYRLSEDSIRRLHILLENTEGKKVAGTDIAVSDPDSIKREKLMEQAADLIAFVTAVKVYFEEYEATIGVSEGMQDWYQAFLKNADQKLNALCSEDVSTSELEAGVDDISGELDYFKSDIYPQMEREKGELERAEEMQELYKAYQELMDAKKRKPFAVDRFKTSRDILYEIYREFAVELVVKNIMSPRDFVDELSIKKEIAELQKRKEIADQRRRQYEILGEEAYICKAINDVLQSKGYTVHDPEDITKMLHQEMHAARLSNGAEIPFYLWKNGSFTQFYEVVPGCLLQLIVHQDGTYSLQTYSDGREGDEAVRESQLKHCSTMLEICDVLQEEYFILYKRDLQQVEEPSKVKSIDSLRKDLLSLERSNIRSGVSGEQNEDRIEDPAQNGRYKAETMDD